jgi:hypothetical protein
MQSKYDAAERTQHSGRPLGTAGTVKAGTGHRPPQGKITQSVRHCWPPVQLHSYC